MFDMPALRQLLTVTAVLLVLDAGWLTANNAYHRQVFAAIQGQPLQVRMIGAVGSYLLLIIGVWFFATRDATSWQEAAGRGALLGLCLYGVYDLTNYATLTKYPVRYMVTDMIWGTCLGAITAAIAHLAT
jgi:uncharacterized membrane protein